MDWFEQHLVTLDNGTSCMMDVNFLCLECGTIGDAFPDVPKSALPQMITEDPEFKLKFEGGRLVFRKTTLVREPFKHKSVFLLQGIGLRMEVAKAFVEEAHFVLKLKMMPRAAGVCVVSIRDIEGTMKDGVLLQIEGLPRDLCWTRVILYSVTENLYQNTLLGEGEALHEEQPMMMFNWMKSQHLGSRAGQLRSSDLTKIPTFVQVMNDVLQIQRDRQARESAEGALQLHADASSTSTSSVVVHTSSRLNDAFGNDFGSAAAVAKAKPKAKPKQPSPAKALQSPPPRLVASVAASQPPPAAVALVPPVAAEVAPPSGSLRSSGGKRAVVLVGSRGSSSGEMPSSMRSNREGGSVTGTPSKDDGGNISIDAILQGMNLGRELNGVVILSQTPQGVPQTNIHVC